MKQLKIWRSLLAALASLGLSACAADAPTGPKVSGQASQGLISELADGLVSKDALVRKNALAQDITVKATIGKDGGTIAIPDAGFEVTIPSGAVKEETEFTVTALKGQLVAYEFGPHGITFPKALQARQDLSSTNWRLLPLKPLIAGYFVDRSDLNSATKTAILSEVIQGVTAPLSKQFSWSIEHFSGYVVAW
jgi:hypothetical protein